jgi:penicillin-binding protein 2
MSGIYPPGSTIKMAVALAALENGIIDYNTKFYCNGLKELGSSTFHCWAKDGHGQLNLMEAIEQSCDVYFYELGLKVGIDKIALMMKKLGLGQYYDIEINDKSKGVVPNIEWKLKRDGLQWSMGETLNASIGQGYLLTTPLQLTTMVSRIANGKFSVTPTLTMKKSQNRFEPLKINPKHLDFIKKSMERVVTGIKGTAKNYQIGSKKIEMAGKTGTVQVVRISEAEREKGLIKNEDRPWKKRDHALFVGYAPVSKPKYAITVVVEHGGSGSSVAAPIARDIFKYIFKV